MLFIFIFVWHLAFKFNFANFTKQIIKKPFIFSEDYKSEELKDLKQYIKRTRLENLKIDFPDKRTFYEKYLKEPWEKVLEKTKGSFNKLSQKVKQALKIVPKY